MYLGRRLPKRILDIMAPRLLGVLKLEQGHFGSGVISALRNLLDRSTTSRGSLVTLGSRSYVVERVGYYFTEGQGRACSPHGDEFVQVEVLLNPCGKMLIPQ